jgi:2'-5' RNA ligase
MMTRVRGLNRRQITRHEDRLAQRVITSLRSVAAATSRQLAAHIVLTAAGDSDVPVQGSNATAGVVVNTNDLGVMRQLWLEQVGSQLVPLVADTWFASAHRVVAQLGPAAPPSVTIPAVSNDAADEYLRGATNRLAGVGDVLWENTRVSLSEGMTAGESVEQLAVRVMMAASVTEPRAEVIARTEVNSAANAGSYQYAQLGALAGLTMTKEWLAVLDGRTREDHRLANGQVVPLDQPFTVGGWSMDHPGDFDAPAGEVINCRCTLTYDVEDHVSGLTAALDGDPLAGQPNVEGVDEPVAGYTAPEAGPEVTEEPDGDDDSDADVVPEQKHTGAMVALIPSEADLARLAITGGETPEELHVTLFFLGEGARYDDAARQQVVTRVQEAVLDQHPLLVTGFGVAVWNPLGDTPALVMNVGGAGLTEARECVGECLEELWCVDMPDQHEPWSPHVCLAYASDPAPLVADALARVGPITLDRVRVAFGQQVTDIPLGYTTVQMQVTTGATTMPYEIRKGGSCPPSKPYGVYKKDGGKKIGCHATKEDAQSQISAIGASEHAASHTVTLATDSPPVTGDDAPSVGAIGNTNLPGTVPANVSWSTELATLPDGSLAEWEGILVVEGMTTGDGREFAPGSLTWAEPWLPLRWAPEDFGEHQGAVNVARIDEIWRDDADPSIIRGRGYFNVSLPEGLTAYQSVDGQMLRGVSVDVDSVKDADVELVFPQDVGDGGDEAEPADDSLLMLFGPPPDKMIFHAGRIRGATLVDLPAFVEAQIQVVKAAPMPGGASPRPLPTTSPRASGDGGREPATVDDIVAELGRLLTDATLGANLARRRQRYDRLAARLKVRYGLTAQPFSEDALSDTVRTLIACGFDDGYVPPSAWMFEHVTNQPVKLGVNIADDNRHIFGYAALWGTCHIGHPDVCITPPREPSHDHYLLGEVLTGEGKRVAVGTVTLGTGHAPMFGVNARQAVEHYDDTGTAVADVVVGNDENGIWYAGAIRHGVPAGRVAELRAAKLSGDWRGIGGKLRLIALLAVNVPGFGVPRLATRVAHGTQTALVAAGLVDETTDSEERATVRRMKDRLAVRIGRDAETRRAALRARVHIGGGE